MGESAMLAGRYRYVRELGRGAASRVIEVRDTVAAPPRALAVKTVPADDGARLALEADRLRSLSHPSLVAMHELLRVDEPLAPPFGLPAGTALLVEELAPGRPSSEALLGLEGEALLGSALKAAHGIAGALAALHGAGLVHGDVKPANIVIDDTGHGRLVDLGLAGPATEHGTVRGTPAFLAPESLLGVRSPGTDLYALGVTLHRWLGGALPPHPGGPLEARAPSVAASSLARLTAPDPVDRPATARDAVRAIAAAASALVELPRTTLEPTGAERALAVTSLPFEAQSADLVERLRERIERGGVVWVSGPPGAGRSRLVREATARVQGQHAASGEPVPTYVVDPRGDPPLVPAIVHLSEGGERAERLATVARVARVPQSIVVEAAEGPESALTVGPLSSGAFGRLLARLVGGEPSASQRQAAREASGGLAGRLVRLFADGWLAGEDPTTAAVLRARAAATTEDGVLPPAAVAAGVRLALYGGSAPVDALDSVREGLALLLRRGAATVDERGRVELRGDRATSLAREGTAKRRAALARSLEPFDARSAAYLAAHRGDAATDAFADVAAAALAEGATSRAERILEDALELAGDDDGLRRLLYEARLAAARYEAARAIAPDDGRAAEALRRAGRLAEAHALLDELPIDRAPITRGWLALAAGDLEGATTHAPDDPGAAALRTWIAIARGDADEAVALAEAALAEEPEPREAVRLWASLGAARHRAGDRQGARTAHERCLEGARALGEWHLEATALGNLGAAHLELGELGPAMDALGEGARRLATLGRDRDLARALANLAAAALVLGDHEAAAGWLVEAEGCVARAPDETTRRHLQGLRAELALRRGDRDGARQAARVAAEDPRWEPRMVALLARHDDSWAARWSGAIDTFDGAIASLRVALARDDVDGARRALAAAEASDWAESLERAFAALDLAEAARDPAGARAAAASARALLDEGARGLDPARRARMRRVPRYLRVLGARAGERRGAGEERWRRLGALAKRLGREEHPPTLRQRIVDAALALVDAERALLVRRGPEGGLTVVARAGVGADDAPSRSVVGRALAAGAPVVSVDALADEALDQVASVHALALRSVLAVPLRALPEVLYMDDRMRTGVFAETDRRLLLDLADLAAIALTGAERLARERDALERLARAKRRLEERVRSQERELAELRPALDDAIVARSPAMEAAVELAMRVADADVPVLLQGESGTGKELLARAIHHRGARAGAPFVAESCAALPDTLVESLLFGHERGAFTGATDARLGLFRAADGGTLFLDEIGEMSPAMQAKILRVLQEGEVRPVGGTEAHRVDVRLVSATHRPLESWVREGRFREDLFYRIAVMRIDVPPLRERPADVAPLVWRFVDRHGDGSVTVSDEAMEALQAHHWQGNVRELENEVRRALLSGGGAIALADLSPALRGEADDPLDLKAQIATLETRLIREALARTEGNRTQAAKILGVSRYGLQKMLKRLTIE